MGGTKVLIRMRLSEGSKSSWSDRHFNQLELGEPVVCFLFFVFFRAMGVQVIMPKENPACFVKVFKTKAMILTYFFYFGENTDTLSWFFSFDGVFKS